MTSRSVTKRRGSLKCSITPIFYIITVLFVRNDPRLTGTAGWPAIFHPCGMPAWVTPRGTSLSPKGRLVLLCMKSAFLDIGLLCSSARGSFLLLSVEGDPGGPRKDWVQVWALAEDRGTYSGGPTSRQL